MRNRIALGALVALLASCGTDPKPPVEQSKPIVDVSASRLAADPAEGLLADGEAQATLTVTLLDTEGAPMAGLQVALTATGEGLTLTQPAAPTDAAGSAVGQLVSSKPGTATVTAKVTDAEGGQHVLAAKASVAFVPGPAAKLVFAVPPSAAQAGVAIAPAVQVAVQDAYGNTLADATPSVSLELGENPGSGTLSGTASAAAVSGIATFSDLSIEVAASGYTLVASAEGLESATSAPFDVSVAAPSQLVFRVQPSAPVAGQAIAPPVEVVVRDSLGNLVTDATPIVAIAIGTNPSSGALSGTRSARAVAGVATFSNLQIDKAGTGYTLAATAEGLAGATSDPFDVGAAAAARLSFVVEPVDAVAGAAIAPAVQVAIEDAFGNRIPDDSTSIDLALADSTGAILAGTTSAVSAAGVASFDDLRIDRVGADYQLVATAEGLTEARSARFAITPADAFDLAFSVEPTTVMAGSAISPAVKVSVLDAYGNVVTGAQSAISVQLAANPGVAQLGGTVLAYPSAGVATFGDLTIDKAESGYTLQANAMGTVGVDAVSAAFDVTPAAPSVLALYVAPSDTAAGAQISPAIEVGVEDRFGNLVTTATDLVTVAIGTNPAGGTLAGTLTATASGGIARFGDLRIDRVGAGYTLTFSASRRPTITSNAFSVLASAPARLAYVQQPSNATSGAAIAPAVELEVLDGYGNRVLEATDPVSISLEGGDPSATLRGALTATPSDGLVRFADLSIDKAANGYVLVAVSGSLTAARSSAFNVAAGAASQLVFAVQPTITAVNDPITPALQVEVLDAAGNHVPAASQVTMSLGANGLAAVLGGTKTVTTNGGVATFADLTINKIGTGFTLIASLGGATGVTTTSQPFDIVSGVPSRLAFTVQPVSTVAGVAIAPAVEVSVQDEFGNLVPNATHPITLAVGTGSGTLLGTTVVDAATGKASFSNVFIEKAATGYTLTATTDGLTSATSATFNITPAPVSASVSTVVAGPESLVADGTAVSTVTVTLKDAFGNPVPGQTVRIASTGTGNTLAQPSAATTAAGVATGSIKSTKAEAKVLTVTVGALELSTHPTVTFVPGAPATASTVVASPATGVVADGQATSTITVTVVDAKANPIPGVTVTLSANGTGNTLSTPAATDASGVTTATLVSTKAETKTITASVGATVFTNKPTVVFVPGAPDPAVSTVAVGANLQAVSVVAGATTTVTITVTAKDAQGNPIPGATVVLAATPADGNTLVQPTTTTAAGVATGTFKSTKAEVKTIGATVTKDGNTVALDAHPTITVTAAVFNKDHSLVSASPTTGIVADDSATSTITVTVRDLYDNPIPGTAVSVLSTGSANAISTPASTDANGVTTATIASTKAEAKTVSAKVGSVAITQTATVTFVPGVANASHSTVAVAPASVTANGSASAAITVTVKDVHDNPVPGATVRLAATDTEGRNTLTQPTGTTPASGVASGSLVSTKAEVKTITATVDGSLELSAHPTVTFVPGAADAAVSTISVSPESLVADNSSLATITVTALDAHGNPVPSAAVTLTALPVTGNTLSTAASTNASGVTTATIKSSKAEAKTITAKIGTSTTLTHTAVVTFVPGAPATTSTVVVSRATGVVADGTDASIVTVTVKDANGNLVPAAAVSLSATGTDNTFATPSGTTNASGVFSSGITSTKAETKTISATVNGALTLTATPTVAFVAGPVSVSRSTAIADPASGVLANNTALSTIRVTVVDAYDNPISGATVALTSTGTGNTLVKPANTGANGQTSGTIKTSVAETKTITVTVSTSLVLDVHPTVTFVAGAVAAAASNLSASPTSGLVANGVAASTLTATCRDVSSNPIANVTVVFSATGTGGTITPVSAVTNASGVATATLVSTKAEAKTLTAVADGVTLTQHPVVTFVPGAPAQAHSLISASPSTVIANNAATAALTVTVRDVFDNPVPGQAVRLLSTGSFNKFTPVTGATNASGQLSATLASSMAETKKVIAEVGGFAVSTNVVFAYTEPQTTALSVPAGGGCLPISYSVKQVQTKRVDVLVEYDSTGSGTFRRATQAASATYDGIYGVETTVSGKPHTFFWNTTADLPRGKVTSGQVRVTPFLDGIAGTPMTASITSLSNQLSFAPTASQSAGTHPRAMAQGDLNGDGKLDLVTSSPDRDEIRVFLGNATGSFGAGTAYASTQPPSGTGDVQEERWPVSLAVVDVDSDGDLDVVSANLVGGGVTVFANITGAGTFPLDNDKAIERPTWSAGLSSPTAIRAADLNRDGSDDLFVAHGGAIAILPNSSGSFPSYTTLSAGTSPSAVVAADLDRNGTLDLAAPDSVSGMVYLFGGFGDGTFAIPTTAAAGTAPSGIVAGDFDADGDLDLAVSNRTSNDVSILLGTGSGGFGAPTSVASGVNPASLVASDLDGDGKLDLAVANETENVLATLLGNGDGTFSPGPRPIASGMPEKLLSGDYNGDGKPDLAVTAWNGAVIDVVLNTRPRFCDPGFEAPANAELGPNPQAMAGGDFNGDGKPDLVVIDATDGTLDVLRGNGSGGFQAALTTTISGGGGAHLVAADFNADGKLDVVTPSEYGANFFSGSGSGTFTAAVATTGGAFPNGLAAGDFNGDDKLDLVALVESGSMVSIFLFGSSGFNAPTHLTVGTAPQSGVTGDFDRDGRVDLALVDLSQVFVLRGNGDGTFDTPVAFTAGAAPRYVEAGDFDLDGFLDLAVANRDGASVSLLLGNGDCSFAPALNSTVGASPQSLEAADVDGDGYLDLAVGFGAGRSAELLFGGAGGMFSGRTQLDVAAVAADASVADFDADGLGDVVAMARSGSPRLTTLLASAPGAFSTPALYPVGDGARYLASADFDRDGTLDLAVSALAAGQISFLGGNADGTLRAAVTTALSAPRASLAADLNRDGITDLVVASGTQLYPLRGGGAGTFTELAPVTFPGTNPEPAALGAGDFNRDGSLDLVALNDIGNTLCLFQGNGALGFGAGSCTVVGDGPVALAIADLNTDGALDVATANSAHESIGVLLGNGNGTFQPLRSIQMPGRTVVGVSVADMDRNGTPDLVFADSATARVGFLSGLGDGNFLAAVAYASPGVPRSIYSDDFDDDGKIDLLVRIAGNGAALFPGTGTGMLGAPSAWYLETDGFEVGDFDRDGEQDLAFARTMSGAVGLCMDR